LPAAKGGHPISSILYIGNIPLGVAEEYINELLYKIEHVVSMRFFTDRRSFQPKWFGFVEMASEAEAKKAMEDLKGNICC
jgi:RNA recognition motif-containing protein